MEYDSIKNIVFVTGTRADFGKLKSLIKILEKNPKFNTKVFVTGMHTNPRYGLTSLEVRKNNIQNIFEYINHTNETPMDMIMSKTIEGFSDYLKRENNEVDLIVVHGDRVEALACSIVGSLNNILVAHIEGGEVSGTIDELIRHSVTKMSHAHFVSNDDAKNRIVQLGENPDDVWVIGSPDLDYMTPDKMIDVDTAKRYYDIPYENYGISLFHPVTTEHRNMKKYTKQYFEALCKSDLNYVVVYPNNDLGSNYIIDEISKLNSDKFKVVKSLRFEYFLSLLKNSDFMIGNSSAGIREAPFFGVPTIDVGTRQSNRSLDDSVFNCGYGVDEILECLFTNKDKRFSDNQQNFGDGRSDIRFESILMDGRIFDIPKQKVFNKV